MSLTLTKSQRKARIIQLLDPLLDDDIIGLVRANSDFTVEVHRALHIPEPVFQVFPIAVQYMIQTVAPAFYNSEIELLRYRNLPDGWLYGVRISEVPNMATREHMNIDFPGSDNPRFQ